MPYIPVTNGLEALSPSEAQQLIAEFAALRTELTDIRTKYAALVALLVAATTLGAGYSAGTGLSASTFTPT
jgi:hypothetical protein